MSIRMNLNSPSLATWQPARPGQADSTTSLQHHDGMTVLHDAGRHKAAAAVLAESTKSLAQGRAASFDAIASKQLCPDSPVRDAGSMAIRGRSERPTLAAIVSAHSMILQAAAPPTGTGAAASSPKANSTRFMLEKNGPIDKQLALQVIRKQAMATSLTAADAGTTFLRNDSDGTRALSRLLSPELATIAKRLVSTMSKTFEAGLKNAGAKPTAEHSDALLAEVFSELIKDFTKMQVSDNFREAVQVIENALDSTAKDQCSKLPADKHAGILATAALCKNDVVKAILLRTLLPQISDLVRNDKTDRQAEVRAFDRFLNENPETQAAGMTMAKMVTLLLSKINGSKGTKQDHLGQTFPQLLLSFKQTTLTDLNKIGKN